MRRAVRLRQRQVLLHHVLRGRLQRMLCVLLLLLLVRLLLLVLGLLLRTQGCVMLLRHVLRPNPARFRVSKKQQQ